MKKINKEQIINYISKPKTYTILLLTLIIALVSSLLLKKGITQVDSAYHITRIKEIATCIKYGDLKALVHPGIHGYGSGLFYPQVFLYIPAVLVVLGVDKIIAYKIFVALVNIATVIIMYFCAKSLTNNRWVGIISAGLYATCAYRMANMFEFTNIGCVQAIAFVPPVILGLYEICYRNSNKWYILSCGILGLIYSHIINFVLVVVFLCLPVILININRLFKEKQRVKHLMYSVIIVILLSAFFTFPFLEQILNYKFVLTENVSIYDITDSIMTFPMSVIGVCSYYKIHDYYLIKIGVGLIIFSISTSYYITKKIIKGKNENYSKYVNILYVIATIYLISMSIKPIWNNVSILESIQFVWRFHIITSVVYCIIAALVVEKFYIKTRKNFNIYKDLAVAIVVSTILFNLIYVTYGYFTPDKIKDDIDEKYKYGSGLEYVPYDAYMHVINKEKNNDDLIYTIDTEGTSYIISYRNNNVDDSYVQIPLFYYKGYNIIESTNSLNYIPDSDTGFLKIHLFNKEGSVTIKYTGTYLARTGYIITYTSIVGIMLYIITKYYKNVTKS